MTRIDFRALVKAGVHFGHQTSRWNPKMKQFIWGHQNNVHLIDVSKTAQQMEKAASFLEGVAAEGKTILWIGTKKPAQEIIQTAAKNLSMPYVVHRWIGGTLSNRHQVRKSVTKLLHYEDVVAKSEKSQTFYTKKELGVFNKMIERLQKNVNGIRNLAWPLGAIVLVDVNKERAALKEAIAMGIPVVALVDTNGDPSLVDYVIPANDDAPRAIKVVIDYLEQAVQKGKADADAKQIKAVASSDVAIVEKSAAEALLDLEDEEGRRTEKPKTTSKKPESKNRAPRR